MAHHHRPIHESCGPGWHLFSPVSALIRVRPLFLLAAAVGIVCALYTHLKEGSPAGEAATEIRMPITNAPLEPDRPDLIGEPRIDE